MPKLNARFLKRLLEPGMYLDNEGLYLRVGPSGSKSWILRTMVHGKRRDIGLGSCALVTLEEARVTARDFRKIARAGGDPLAGRAKSLVTFEQAARSVLETNKPNWRSEKHAVIWMSSLERFVFPAFGDRPIETIGSYDVLSVLSPIWVIKHDTARRVKQRIGKIFDWAKVAGHCPHENPVNGLERALPTVKTPTIHRASMPWQQLPEFFKELQGREGVSARALEFLILTCCRSKEVRGAHWEEIDGATWVVPGIRMKGGLEHRVPLPEPAL